MLIVGGSTASDDAISSARIYDPATGLFTTVGGLHQARSRQQAAVLNGGFVVVLGGTRDDGTATASVELWDPGTQSFLSGGS